MREAHRARPAGCRAMTWIMYSKPRTQRETGPQRNQYWRRAVSIASAAVQIAEDLHGALNERGVLIVGLGEIADLIVRQLKAAGIERISMTGPEQRAEQEALALGFHFVPFERLGEGLVRADIAVTAVGLGRYLLGRPWSRMRCANAGAGHVVLGRGRAGNIDQMSATS